MISCTNTDGKITPLRFRFIDKDGSLITVKVDRLVSSEQNNNRFGASFECTATFYGEEKHFFLYYSNFSGKWAITKIGV